MRNISKLIIKTPEWHWRCSDVFIVNIKHISHLFLLFLLLILNREMLAGYDFQGYCNLERWQLSHCCALTLSWRKSLSYRNQSIDLQTKSMDWFLYNRNLRHERVNPFYATLVSFYTSRNNVQETSATKLVKRPSGRLLLKFPEERNLTWIFAQ